MKFEVETSCVLGIRLDCAISSARKIDTNRQSESLQQPRALAGAGASKLTTAAHEALIAPQSHSKVTKFLPALHTPEVARALITRATSNPPELLPAGGYTRELHRCEANPEHDGTPFPRGLSSKGGQDDD